MDVFPGFRGFAAALLLASLSLSACGNRFDLATARGRQARIDDANYYLSKGQCAQGLDAILPLYGSAHVDDEVRIITASAYACEASFNLLTLAGSLPGAANIFQAIAKSMTNRPNDGARAAMYQAQDVLTRNGTLLGASSRSPEVNTYMVFLQFGTIGAVIRNYGSPALDGGQGSDLVYPIGSNPAGKMTDVDACSLPVALASIVDSFAHSDLVDPSMQSVTQELDQICQTYTPTHQSCSVLSQARTACNGGANTAAQAASAVVNGVNSVW